MKKISVTRVLWHVTHTITKFIRLVLCYCVDLILLLIFQLFYLFFFLVVFFFVVVYSHVNFVAIAIAITWSCAPFKHWPLDRPTN